MSRYRWAVGMFVAVAIHCQTVAQITVLEIATGLDNPVFITSPPGDDRLFVVERTGTIRIIESGTVLPTPFLDISAMTDTFSERGLLCLAFHPDYASNGRFYIYYSLDPGGDLVLAEYLVSGDPYVAEAGSANVLLTEPHPAGNHYAGMLAFKPDEAENYLYLSIGDGEGPGDPNENAQNINTVFGKILRIDVDNGGQAAPTNPFVGQDGNDYVWAYGLRNPWRYSFDRLTGDMYIADVGQDAVEEVDFIPGTSGGGQNFGWDDLEGSNDFECTDCDAVRMNTVLPFYEYPHGTSRSVIGGYVYRGNDIPSLYGAYVFGDLFGAVWSLRYDGTTVSDFQVRTAQLNPSGGLIVSFGEDVRGELYIVGFGGTISQIVDLSPPQLGPMSGGGFYEVGDSVTISVEVIGASGVAVFQWYKNSLSAPVVDAPGISGATTSELSFASLQESDSGSYFLRIDDELKAIVTSPYITVTVVPEGALPAVGLLMLIAIAFVLSALGAIALPRTYRAK